MVVWILVKVEGGGREGEGGECGGDNPIISNE